MFVACCPFLLTVTVRMNTKGGLRCGESVVKITNMRRATPRLCPDLSRTDEEREEGRVCEDYFGVKYGDTF